MRENLDSEGETHGTYTAHCPCTCDFEVTASPFEVWCIARDTIRGRLELIRPRFKVILNPTSMVRTGYAWVELV